MIPDIIFARLRALVDDRVYPNIFAQPDTRSAPTWPAIRYTVVSVDPATSLAGNDITRDDVTVRLDIVAVRYSQLLSLKAEVADAMRDTDPPSTRQPGGFETYDTDTKTHRALMEYTFYPSSEAGDSPC